MLSSLFFLISHSWKTVRFTHCRSAGADTSCSFVLKMNWRRNLFNSRPQGGWALKCQLKHDRAQRQLRCKGTEAPFHPTAFKSCSFCVCLLLATLSCDYLENSFELLVPTAGRAGRKLPRYSQNLLLPLHTDTGVTTSADLKPYPQSAHVKGLLLSLLWQALDHNHDLTSPGLSMIPRPQRVWPKEEGDELKIALLWERGASLQPDFPLQTCVEFIPGSVQHAHWFPSASWYQPFYPSVVLVPVLTFNTVLKECNQCS